jgi:large subunit ribosomal protein L1
MSQRGKTYRDAKEKVDRNREYAPAEAVKLVKELKRAKFDESVEIHVRTGLNVRHADEQLRGTIALPHGLGKDVKIAVFAPARRPRRPRRPAPTSSAPRTLPTASRTRASPISTSRSRPRT